MKGDALDPKALIREAYAIEGITAPEGALREAAAVTPLDRCLVETDAPFLAPAPRKSSDTNEPAFIVHTAKRLAKAMKVPFEELAEATTSNARRFFGID